VRYRRGDQDGHDDELQEVAREQGDEAGHRRAQYLPHADLFRSLLRREGGEAEQAQARNGDGEPGEEGEERGEALVVAVLPVERFVRERVAEDVAGEETV